MFGKKDIDIEGGVGDLEGYKKKFSELDKQKKIIYLFSLIIAIIGFGFLVTGGYLFYKYPYQNYLVSKRNERSLKKFDESLQNKTTKGINELKIIEKKKIPLQFPYKMEISKINLNWLVYPTEYEEEFPCGINKKYLDSYGACHYPETCLPGEIGVCAIAGHRTTYGAPFRDIDKLVKGDKIILSKESIVYIYEVLEVKIISADYIKILDPPEEGKAFLVLTACHPPGSAKKRIAVIAILEGDG